MDKQDIKWKSWPIYIIWLACLISRNWRVMSMPCKSRSACEMVLIFLLYLMLYKRFYWRHLHQLRSHISFQCIPFGIYSRGPFYWHGLTLIIAWISNYMPSKMWDENIYSQLLKFGNRLVISSHISWWMSLLIHDGIKYFHVNLEYDLHG